MCYYSVFLHMQTNTFQGVVITDGSQSYAVFIYKCGLLQWSGLDRFYRHAVIGYNMKGQFMNHPFSGFGVATNVACVNSPETSWTTLLYDIGEIRDELQLSRMECLKTFQNDVSLFGNSVKEIAVIVPACPCSLFQAFRDRRLFRVNDRTNDQARCFAQRFTNSIGHHICCYSLV